MRNIISEQIANDNTISTKVDNFFKTNKLYKILGRCGFYKQKGISCVKVAKELFSLVFHGKNLYRALSMGTGEVDFKKNTAYRFLNNPSHNWRKLLIILVTQIISFLNTLTSEDRQNVIIIDDTLFDRNRSKSVELLTRVFDHTTKKYVKGLKMLTLGWSDGSTFLPVAFSLLSSQRSKNRLCDINQKIDKRTVGYKRRREAVVKLTDTMFELLESIKGLPAQYVLFDSWYAFPATIARIVEDFRLQVVCMIKKTYRTYYCYDGKWMPLKDLYKQLPKSTDKNIKGELIVGMRRNKQSDPINVKIVFVSDRGSKEWLALLSTDIELTAEEIIRLYGKRWDIEVFFKMSKSYLALAKEFQGRSYDMMVAHTTIVFLRYIMLAVESRNSKDLRTAGELFFYVCDEVDDIKYTEALLLILELLKKLLSEVALLPEKQVNELMDLFVSSLPSIFKQRLKICA